MKRSLVAVVALLALFIFAGSPLAAAEDIAITVSPNVINIASASTVVTVHTDIPYACVVGASVTLNGIEIDWWKSDNQGNFVAKFEAVAVKGIVDAGTKATLMLTGLTKDGDEFSGDDCVDVIDVSGEKKK